MVSFFKHRQHLDFAAAVVEHHNWSLVGVNHAKSGKIELAVCEWLELSQFSDEQKGIAHLKNKLKQHHLDQNGLATVLGLGEYTLLSIEAPQVPANEIRAAVRWQIQDLIDFHIDDAIIDVFDAPMQSNSQQRSIYVVISKKKNLEQRIALLQEIDANLTVVDIPELILRNIAAHLAENESGMVMLYFDDNMGLLTLVRKNVLYLARSLDIGLFHLKVGENNSAEAVKNNIDYVCLEIQRSLDYFDRYFGMAPMQNIVVAPLQDVCPSMCKHIQQQLGLSARFFSVEEFVTLRQLLSTEQQRRGLMALGAALRQEAATL